MNRLRSLLVMTVAGSLLLAIRKRRRPPRAVSTMSRTAPTRRHQQPCGASGADDAEPHTMTLVTLILVVIAVVAIALTSALVFRQRKLRTGGVLAARPRRGRRG